MNQYTGDGIMALFGAPIAHEDHAQRACYAALHLRDGAARLRRRGASASTASPFCVRIGLNSGEVVVGRIGDDLRMDYTAQGHTVGLAQRMEALAESGHICLSEHTARLVEGYFQLRGPRRRIEVKGVARAGRASSTSRGWARFAPASTARARAACRASSGATATWPCSRPRSSARAAAAARWWAWWPRRAPASRACAPSSSTAAGRAAFRCSRARGVAHGKSIPMLPMLELWRAFFGITERRRRRGDAGEDRRAAVADGRELPRGAAPSLRLVRRARPGEPGARQSTPSSARSACTAW